MINGVDPATDLSANPAPGGTEVTRHRRRIGSALLVSGVLLALAACGGDPASPSGGGGGDGDAGSGEPAITATFDISGDVTIKKTITGVLPANKDGSKPATCEEYAKGDTPASGRPGLQLPNFVSVGDVDGHRLQLDARISPYHGPGSYPRAELSGQGNPPGFVIDDHSLVAKEESSASVTVKADGSGSFQFDTLTETTPGLPDPQSVTGQLTWTCKNG